MGLLLLGCIPIQRGKRSSVILSKIIHSLFVLGFMAVGVMMAFGPGFSLLGAVNFVLFWGGRSSACRSTISQVEAGFCDALIT